MASLVFSNVSFAYPGSPAQIFNAIDFGVSEGWTGVIGANGAGKTTLLQLACHSLAPSLGTIHRPDHVLYCPQRTDEPMDAFATFLHSSDGEAYRLRGQLGIEDDWLDRWHTLSHGERKRAQIATCIHLRPNLLAVDEPTNHLDREAGERIRDALHQFRGIGLLVSHDRKLLDALCGHSLFVSPPHVVLRSGGYTTAMAEIEQEAELAREERSRSSRERRRMEQEVVRRREHLAKAEKKKSLHGIDPRDSDARQKAYAARNADSGVGKRVRHTHGRIRQAEKAESSIDVVARNRLGIGIAGASSARNVLFRVKEMRRSLGEERSLLVPDLVMQPQDRIALIGPNGTGKSTLVRWLMQQLDLPTRRFVYLPQEIPAEDSASILDEARALRGDALGDVMRWVSRLGSDVEQLLSSAIPSPGEIRKLMLALRMSDTPHLLVMDEPTNHMDLPSIDCMEAALCECPSALLLVSHDLRFLKTLTTSVWEIVPDQADPDVFRLHPHASWRTRGDRNEA